LADQRPIWADFRHLYRILSDTAAQTGPIRPRPI